MKSLDENDLGLFEAADELAAAIDGWWRGLSRRVRLSGHRVRNGVGSSPDDIAPRRGRCDLGTWQV